MVPRDAFIAVYMMSNRKHGTLTIGVTSNLIGTTCTWRSSPEAVFLDGRDNSPVMTRLGCAPVGPHVPARKEVDAFPNLSRARKTHGFDQYACLAAELRFSPDSRAQKRE